MIIVEDEPMTRSGLRDQIPWGELGVEVVGEASDGIEALEVIERTLPDIVLSDVRMPRMNGIELGNEIRKRGMDTRVIFISAYTDKELLMSAIKVKAEDYIEKPVNRRRTTEKMRQIVQDINRERRKMMRDDCRESHDFISEYGVTVGVMTEFVHAHFEEDISVAAIAAEVGLSPNHANKVFKEKTGRTIKKYLTSMRLQKAVELLMDPSLRLNEVAQQCGFSDSNYFSRVFRSYTGKLPSEYRKSSDEKNEDSVSQ